MATRSKTQRKQNGRDRLGVIKKGGAGTKVGTASLKSIRSLRKRKQ
jgi:hypothetical protein